MMYDMDPSHELDNCSRCLGLNGGFLGNEIRHPVEGGGYRLLCDYCDYAVGAGDGEMICVCGNPVGSRHAVMRMKQIEEAWREGLALRMCGGDDGEYGPQHLVLVLLDKDAEPDNPCDVDYMTEISS